jgi:biofilm protein TabA
MILDLIERSALYELLHKGFAAAFEFLRRDDLATIPVGKHEIVGDLVFVLVSMDQSRGPTSRLEAHRKYIDVQYVIAGDERMGWRPIEGLATTEPYDADKDIEFFADVPAAWFAVDPGQFAIFLPTDAHAPLAGSGAIHKAVVKVAVDYRQ